MSSDTRTKLDRIELDGLDASTVAKLDRVLDLLADSGSVVVAFSGGADSALLAFLAHRQLGSSAVAVTAVSPSLAADELRECELLAAEWGLAHATVPAAEMERPEYRANDIDRCYHCKAELMSVVAPIAEANHGATVVLGVNLDDLDDHRPGQRAALERGAKFPFVDAGLTKHEVRAASRALGLRTWDKPSAACLASRIPYGTPVTVAVLGRVERAEAALRRLGFTQCRVRHYGDTARIEVEIDQLKSVVDRRDAVIAAVRAAGYQRVTVDLEGFRSGNLNDAV